MVVQRRTPAKSILLSDDSSRLLLQTHFANARSIPAGSAVGTSESSTSELTAAPKKKAQQNLATVFRCPCCKHAVDSVECRVDHKGKVAEASCWVCKERYRTSADALTEPVDVYCEWIDERRRANGGGRRDCDGDVMMVDA